MDYREFRKFSPTLIHYWPNGKKINDKIRMVPDIFNNVDWEAWTMMVRGLIYTDNINLFKTSHGSLPVIPQQERFGYSDTFT